MTDLVVKPVETRRERRLFLDFPRTLYRDDPNWVPPLRLVQKELVGYGRHPFYQRNEAQTFLAFRGGEVCGRIAAIWNRDHIERYQEARGFFGFFECRNDREAAHGLLEAVRRWFADRGIGLLRGPANPSQNYELGLLVEGFDSPPTFLMTYNPPYYAELIESFGFRKAQDLYAYWGNLEMLPKSQEKVHPLAEQIKERFGAKVRCLDRRRFLADVELFVSIYNRSLANTWGFVPMSPAELRHMARALRFLVIPELCLGVEVDGRIVGAIMCLPDYNPCIRRIRGRLFPLGFLRMLWSKRRVKRVRMVSTNVLPEYHRMGLPLVLLDAMVEPALRYGVEEAEFSWVLESNTLSRGSLEKGGAIRTKTYRIYDFGS